VLQRSLRCQLHGFADQLQQRMHGPRNRSVKLRQVQCRVRPRGQLRRWAVCVRWRSLALQQPVRRSADERRQLRRVRQSVRSEQSVRERAMPTRLRDRAYIVRGPQGRPQLRRLADGHHQLWLLWDALPGRRLVHERGLRVPHGRHQLPRRLRRWRWVWRVRQPADERGQLRIMRKPVRHGRRLQPGDVLARVLRGASAVRRRVRRPYQRQDQLRLVQHTLRQLRSVREQRLRVRDGLYGVQRELRQPAHEREQLWYLQQGVPHRRRVCGRRVPVERRDDVTVRSGRSGRGGQRRRWPDKPHPS
jgi:hypothetical protein